MNRVAGLLLRLRFLVSILESSLAFDFALPVSDLTEHEFFRDTVVRFVLE